MSSRLWAFEQACRRSGPISLNVEEADAVAHPFEERNIHPAIVHVSLRLFDDGHYSQATFEGYKYIDNEVKRISGLNDSGYKLMMAAFSESAPKIRLTPLLTQSDKDEQTGYKFIFAGAMSAIRNPRGHEINVDPIGLCLDHLSFGSVLLRRLENASI